MHYKTSLQSRIIVCLSVILQTRPQPPLTPPPPQSEVSKLTAQPDNSPSKIFPLKDYELHFSIFMMLKLNFPAAEQCRLIIQHEPDGGYNAVTCSRIAANSGGGALLRGGIKEGNKYRTVFQLQLLQLHAILGKLGRALSSASLPE